MTAGMAKRISTLRLLAILLVACMAFSVFLDMKVVSTSKTNHVVSIREVRDPTVSSERMRNLNDPKKDSSPENGRVGQKIPQNGLQTSSTDPSKKNRAKKNVTPSSDPLHPDPKRPHPLLHSNIMPPIGGDPNKETEHAVAKPKVPLEIPDDPEAYMKSHKEKMQVVMSKKEQMKQEERMQEQKKRRDVFPKLFWMFNQLNKPNPNVDKNKTRLVFDLSAKAKKAGKIGPFTEKKRINKALKSISEPGHEDELIELAREAIIGADSEDSVGQGAPVLTKGEVEAEEAPKAVASAKTDPPKPAAAKGTPKLADARRFLSKTGASAPKVKPKPKPKKGPGVSHAIDHNELALSEQEIKDLKETVAELNINQTVTNTHLYGPVVNNTLIILIQVHSRVQHLAQLIQSLSKAAYVKECLVVFSHDFWDPDINQLVAGITTFRTMQIFFPFSVQLHPHSFPGLDPRDCHWNHVIRRSQKYMKHGRVCLNQPWPDSFGHYREPRFTQLKHHWWWKAYKVFDDLVVTRNFTGDVLFLEDDHYVAPDIVHTLRLLRSMAGERRAHVLSVGNFVPSNPASNGNLAFLGDWGGTKYNLGFAFNSKTWKLIKSQADFFCTFDDYNWDWTLASLLTKRLALKNAMLAAKLSRVYHIGTSCGTHAKPNASCNLNEALNLANKKINLVQKYLFPKELKVIGSLKNIVKQKSNNGGWGDLRDRKLCAALANGTASEDTIAGLQFPEFVL